MRDYDQNYYAIQDNFVLETTNQAKELGLDDKTIALVRLANNTALNTLTELPLRINECIEAKATVTEIKEVLYQAAPYIGFARVNEALDIINWELQEQNLELEVEDQATVNNETRFEKGLETQCAIFGKDHIMTLRENAPDNQKHIFDNLAANCFGDYYTRGTLDVRQREIITFTLITTIGGADSQALSHAKANKAVGNSKETLLAVTTACLPYNGYPRTLNANKAINEAYKD